jgi:CO dehydrogenase/acetyl-CoA synthase alpha subunit
MMLLKAEIAIKMPGNLRYVNDYIEGCWPHVTVLTSSIVRYDSNSGLEEKFSGYVQAQEKILKDRLEKIQYDIDAIGTVSLILRSERIEGVCDIRRSSWLNLDPPSRSLYF